MLINAKAILIFFSTIYQNNPLFALLSLSVSSSFYRDASPESSLLMLARKEPGFFSSFLCFSLFCSSCFTVHTGRISNGNSFPRGEVFSKKNVPYVSAAKSSSLRAMMQFGPFLVQKNKKKARKKENFFLLLLPLLYFLLFLFRYKFLSFHLSFGWNENRRRHMHFFSAIFSVKSLLTK